MGWLEVAAEETEAGGERGLYGLMPKCRDQARLPPWGLVLLRPSHQPACSSTPSSGQAGARGEPGSGHCFSGVTGLETWAAGQGPGGASARRWAGVRSGRRPALIGTRWLHWEPSLASLILPGVPATRRGQRRAGCRFSQVWGHPGGMAFHVVME